VRLEGAAARDLAARLRRIGDEIDAISGGLPAEVWGDAGLATAAMSVAEALSRVGDVTQRALAELADGVVEAAQTIEGVDSMLGGVVAAVESTVSEIFE
jgi:hypothetical protein